ncbi:hypothetical protein RhiirA5_386072 [Rhizophagus irregularis]|uniref:Uncharacterized protein n=1 Tax=Rhizophagus irregularis TaxID=588596 RepID=A0A2I1EZM8_9GLOM|nr:hypothetical protein RhiirA5_386072 [Rhizophagus irregularis]PKC67297.1 hypothetical protein RhiirA1_393834 [Rhizophagus irregularis]PKY27579.1 hypothetical protein RhiirB3_390397 [Rhizophagus irregularis]
MADREKREVQKTYHHEIVPLINHLFNQKSKYLCIRKINISQALLPHTMMSSHTQKGLGKNKVWIKQGLVNSLILKFNTTDDGFKTPSMISPVNKKTKQIPPKCTGQNQNFWLYE